MSFTIESFTIGNHIEGISDLKMVAKRYRPRDTCCSDGLTLILVHGTGYHKEQWEPTLEKLFGLQLQNTESVRIREAWSFDYPNHGEAAVVNEETLKGRKHGVSEPECGLAIHNFLESSHVFGHTLVAVGHSVGTTALLFAAIPSLPDKTPFAAMVLVEPVFAPKDLYEEKIRNQGIAMFSKAIAMRRDTWDSKEEAYEHMKKRLPWKAWDDAVLRIYTDQGLRVLPSPTRHGETIVTLKCTKEQERSVWLRPEPTYHAIEKLDKLCSLAPIHIILGERNDVMPRFTQDWLEKIHGKSFASMRRVPGVGHNIPQEAPERLAASISEALKATFSPPRAAL